MPTYDYGCDACGNTWAVEQRISDDKIKKCPKCKKHKARRFISGGSFILKGGGWYADGYGSSGKSGKPGKSDKSGDSGSKSSDSSSKSSDSSSKSSDSGSSGSSSSD